MDCADEDDPVIEMRVDPEGKWVRYADVNHAQLAIGPADICRSCFDKDDCLFHRKGFRALQCPARKG
jgi:hypothetical protein